MYGTLLRLNPRSVLTDRGFRRALWIILWMIFTAPRLQGAGITETAVDTRFVQERVNNIEPNVSRVGSFDFSVVVVRNAGWQPDEIDTTIREAAAIFWHRCRLPISMDRVFTIDLSDDYQVLDETEEERLVGGLAERPMVLFVNTTTERHNAYSYLESWPISRAGTVWITRDAPTVCRGPLLAHEIGHVALNDPAHSDDPDNLMSHRCGHSNLTNQRINTELSEQQCTLLKRRFCADGSCK